MTDSQPARGSLVIPDDLRAMHESAVALAGEHGRIQGYTLRKLIEEIARLRVEPVAGGGEVTTDLVCSILDAYHGMPHGGNTHSLDAVMRMRAALVAALQVKP